MEINSNVIYKAIPSIITFPSVIAFQLRGIHLRILELGKYDVIWLSSIHTALMIYLEHEIENIVFNTVC